MKTEQGRFILVVEDSPTQAGQIEETLRRAGYASKLAHSGAEALGILESEKPVLVIADRVMPEMDGFVCERAHHQLIPDRQQSSMIQAFYRSFRAAHNQADFRIRLVLDELQDQQLLAFYRQGPDDFE